MSDYLGPNQTRVLDAEDRSFESVVFQKRKPPLSSEYNLEGSIFSLRDSETNRYMIPSGWSYVGSVRDGISESAATAGDVITSSSYSANSFKLIALDKGQDKQFNVAWVNGWRVLVQGSLSTTLNNIITLASPETGTRVDFVFLEVWRKLISPTDTIYKFGNFLYGGINPSNDLIDPAVNIETSLRIQVQYRIRVVSDIDIESYSEGFDPVKVFVQGPLPVPITTCSNAYFTQVPGDLGLWIAGAGDSAAQETLQTVDGHTYAIPMFAITRRNTSSYDPDARSNGAGFSLSDYLAGTASDRPDNLYNDWIVSNDILDLRHRVRLGEDLQKVCSDAFDNLMKGTLRGRMTKSTLGEDHFGVEMTQADAVSNVDKAGSNKIATGDGIRRAFSNAAQTQPESFVVRTVNDKTTGTPATNWALGDAVQISLSGYPSGSVVVSVQQIYTTAGLLTITTDYTLSSLPNSLLTISIPGSSSLIGTSTPFTVEYTISFPAGPYGLTDVPSEFLEFRKEDSTSSIATQDMDIRVRTAAPVVTDDGTMFNMLHNALGNITELYNFGHQMILHVPGTGTETVTFPRTVEGYNILGVFSALVDGTYRTTSVSRTASVYSVGLGSPAVSIGNDVELGLYTEAKFFEMNKQGRAVIDTFEMTELTPDETADGARVKFHINTTDRAALAVASNINNNGAGIAYVNGVQKTLTTNNRDLPTDSTKTYLEVEFSLADTPASGAGVEVPVLMRSAIDSNEGYTFFYETMPYQGLLDSTTSGYIEKTGRSLITTSGSGLITDYTYSQGQALFDPDSTVIEGVGSTEWTSNIREGYLIRADSDATKEYRITEVFDDNTLIVANKPDASGTENYTIVAKDKSFYDWPNIIDRLPTLEADLDSSGLSTLLSTVISDENPVLETRIIYRVQDIENLPPNSVWIGVNSADRGRSTVNIPGAPFGRENLGLVYEKIDSSANYKKLYQSYILNEENDGRLFLMVVSGETGNDTSSNIFNERSDMDSVDIFELPGRPIMMKRVR